MGVFFPEFRFENAKAIARHLRFIFLPHTQEIAGRIANKGNPQISLSVRRFDNLTPIYRDVFHNIVDAIDIDKRQQTRPPGNSPAGHPLADQMSGLIRKFGLIGVFPAQLPSENILIESRRPTGICRRYLKVRKSAVPGQKPIHAR